MRIWRFYPYQFIVFMNRKMLLNGDLYSRLDQTNPKDLKT